MINPVNRLGTSPGVESFHVDSRKEIVHPPLSGRFFADQRDNRPGSGLISMRVEDERIENGTNSLYSRRG